MSDDIEVTPPAPAPLEVDRFRTATPMWATIVLHYLAAFLLLSPTYIVPDSVGIYAYLRSMLLDHDLLFINEWFGFHLVRHGITLFAEITPLGTVANHWSIGTSLLSAPSYLLAHLFTPGRGDGFTALYALTLAFVTIALAVATSLVLRATCRLLAPAATWRQHAGAVVAIVIGTPFLYYELFLPLSSQIASTLAVSAFVLLLLKDDRPQSGALTGLAFGFALATRLQHVVLLPPLLFHLFRSRRSLRYNLSLVAGAAIGYLPQAAAWCVIYGSPLGPLTAGVATWTPFRHFALAESLFSSYHGLFTWSPVVLLAIIGWALEWRKGERAAIEFFFLAWSAELVANGALDCCFWTGSSFGARRLFDLAGAYAVGLIWFIRKTRWWGVAATAAAVLWSASLTLAAATQHLDMEHDVAPSTLLRAPWSIGWRDVAIVLQHSALMRRPLAALAAAAFSSVVLLALLWLAGTRQRLLRGGAVALLATSALLFGAWIPTRERAPRELQRASIDAPLARSLGPLLDAENLARRALEHYQRTGPPGKVEQAERELEQLQRRIAAARSGS